MMKLFVRALVNALGLWVCVQLLSGVSLSGSGSTLKIVIYYVIAGAILGIVNFLVRPFLVILSLPLYIMTLGLFFVVVNAAMLGLTSWLTGALSIGIVVNGFQAALLGGIIIGLVNVVVDAFLPVEYRRH
ncbi:MAG: phage holin family protein [Actinomycetaceae bacterium]|nr:phage holin family protein [Actinomycetaceae bacterium]